MNNTVDTLAQLVAFPSVCGTPNSAIIDWLEARLSLLGAHILRVPGEELERYNLFARIGPDVAGGIVLSAHADVVPTEGQSWSSDPFTLTERDGRLYGRGSSDMKGFLACMVTAAAKATISPLKQPLYLAISYDEELGCLGVRFLLRKLQETGLAASGCIIGEPTQMQVAVAHKGKVALRIKCRGKSAHSANPLNGINAIALAASMVSELQTLQKYIEDTEEHDKRFEVPFSTVQVGLIEGGVALNIVPEHCNLMVEIRVLPHLLPDVYIAWLRAAAQRVVTQNGQGAVIEVEVINSYPGLSYDENESGILSLGLRSISQNTTTVIDFGTEAGLFARELNLPCIVCGPGSIARAHKADEYITRQELEDSDLFLSRIIEDLCNRC